jgi:thiamine kinase-like enzyme
MPFKNYKAVKLIQDYPFSNVEVVERKGDKYILKSVPDFFGDQPYRQRYLADKCKRTRIPKIHWIRKLGGRVYFLMDYIEKDERIVTTGTYIRTLNVFHRETAGCRSRLFPRYDFAVFRDEFVKSERLMPKALYAQLKRRMEMLQTVFATPTSVVHGDWVPAQLIPHKGRHHIIDFEMSFNGPAVLDHAHFFYKEKTVSAEVLKLIGTDRRMFVKACAVEALRKLGWVMNGLEGGHTTYKFKPEIKEYVSILKRVVKELR